MILKIKENSIDLAELKNVLSEEFEDTYKISSRGKAAIVLAKGKTTGAIVTLLKKKVYVTGSFPAQWMTIVYMLLLIALGILLPLALYFIFYHKKMKACEKEVGGFLKEAYADKILK